MAEIHDRAYEARLKITQLRAMIRASRPYADVVQCARELVVLDDRITELEKAQESTECQ